MVYIYKGTLYDGLTITVPTGTTVYEARIFNPVTKEFASFEKQDDGTYALAPAKTINLSTGSYSLEIYDSAVRMLSSVANFAKVVESSKAAPNQTSN